MEVLSPQAQVSIDLTGGVRPARLDGVAPSGCGTIAWERLPGDGLMTAVSNIRLMHFLQRVAIQFNEAGIPLMALKGAALNLTVCRSPGDRAMRDLDLMIAPGHVQKAQALLEGLRCLRSQTLVREDFFPRYYYEIEYSSGNVRPLTIDLHVRPFRLLRYARTVPLDAFWARAKCIPMGRASVLIPCTEDMLLHLAVHAAVHGNTSEKWLSDIKQWVAFHSDALDWDRFIESARAWRLTIPARIGIQSTEDRFGRVCPAEVTRKLRRSRNGWRDRLAIWHAPRDDEHFAAHAIVNFVTTPGLLFPLGYLLAVVFPGRGHMGQWYQRRHRGWLLCAHLLRIVGPLLGGLARHWLPATKTQVHKSALHGQGVFAVTDIAQGEVIAYYDGVPINRDGPYTVNDVNAPAANHRHEITGSLKFLNHNCRPNGELSNLKLIALRPIRVGEEITIHYGPGVCGCGQQTHEGQRDQRLIKPAWRSRSMASASMNTAEGIR